MQVSLHFPGIGHSFLQLHGAVDGVFFRFANIFLLWAVIMSFMLGQVA